MMRYFVQNSERKGSCYHEFYKGKWDQKTFWKSDSICLHDDILFECIGLAEAFKTLVDNYDPFGETEINHYQWKSIGVFIEDKDSISKAVYDEADNWLEKVFAEHDCFTILGI